MEKTTTNRRSQIGLLLCVMLTGCNVGPKYHPPAIQPPPAFKEAPPATSSSNPPQPQTNQNGNRDNGAQENGTWTVAQPADEKIRGDWWAIFNEPELNDLEGQLNIDNQNIKLYFENFMEARALVREARALYFPTVSFGPSYSRSAFLGKSQCHFKFQRRTSSHRFTPCLWIFHGPPISLAESAMKSVQAQYTAQVNAADLENERLVEQADLAEYFFEIRGQDALIQLFTQTVAPIRSRWI